MYADSTQDVPWSGLDERQLIGRLYRYPQRKQVIVYHFITWDKADRKLHNLACDKIMIMDSFSMSGPALSKYCQPRRLPLFHLHAGEALSLAVRAGNLGDIEEVPSHRSKTELLPASDESDSEASCAPTNTITMSRTRPTRISSPQHDVTLPSAPAFPTHNAIAPSREAGPSPAPPMRSFPSASTSSVLPPIPTSTGSDTSPHTSPEVTSLAVPSPAPDAPITSPPSPLPTLEGHASFSPSPQLALIELAHTASQAVAAPLAPLPGHGVHTNIAEHRSPMSSSQPTTQPPPNYICSSGASSSHARASGSYARGPQGHDSIGATPSSSRVVPASLFPPDISHLSGPASVLAPTPPCPSSGSQPYLSQHEYDQPVPQLMSDEPPLVPPSLFVAKVAELAADHHLSVGSSTSGTIASTSPDESEDMFDRFVAWPEYNANLSPVLSLQPMLTADPSSPPASRSTTPNGSYPSTATSLTLTSSQTESVSAPAHPSTTPPSAPDPVLGACAFILYISTTRSNFTLRRLFHAVAQDQSLACPPAASPLSSEAVSLDILPLPQSHIPATDLRNAESSTQAVDKGKRRADRPASPPPKKQRVNSNRPRAAAFFKAHLMPPPKEPSVSQPQPVPISSTSKSGVAYRVRRPGTNAGSPGLPSLGGDASTLRVKRRPVP